MHVLTKDEIRFITETVDKAGITISHLHDDLVDHLCCEVEYELENGLNFNQAFEKIKTVVGIRDLQQVQVNTLLLIDKHYRIMKTMMKVSGVASTSLLMFGSLFKIMHWPMATILLVVGFFLMGFFFLPSAMYIMQKENKDVKRPLLYLTAFLGSFGFIMGSFFKVMHWPGANILLTAGMGVLCLLFMPALLVFLRKKAENPKEKSVYTLGVISGMIYMLAILFKMMHWPGASIMLMLGAIALVFLFIIPYTFFLFKDEEYVKAKFIYLIAAFTWLMLFTMLLALNVQGEVLKGFSHVDEKLIKTTSIYESKSDELIQAFKDSAVYNSMLEVKKESDDMVFYINDLKLEIIKKFHEGDNFDESSIVEGKTVNLEKWKGGGQSNTFAPQFIMLGNEEHNGKAPELESKIEEYKKALLTQIDNDAETSRLINALLKTDVPEDTPEWFSTWEEYCFKKTTIVACNNVLTSLQRNVRMAEYETLSCLVHK